MRVGALYPQTELHGDPSAVRQIGQAVEALNFGHLLAHDHVLGAVHSGRTPELTGPFTNKDPFHDPLTMFAYLAAVTQHIELVTGILVLPQRPTALVARQAADVDLLSGGRLRLGVAVGWNYVEYEALGQPFHARGAREEEQIELLRRLFTEPVVSFQGRFDRIDRATLNPKPKGPIPIWLGGSSPAAFERAAHLGDGFIFLGDGIDQTISNWHQLRERVHELNRPIDGFGAEYIASPKTDLNHLINERDQWQNAGGTHFTISSTGLGLNSTEAHIGYLTTAAKAFGLAGEPSD